MKKKVLITLACALVLMFAVAFTACTEKKSNTTPTTSVDVIVYDALAQPLSGAKVSLCTTGGQSVTTNSDGAATLTNVAAGEHVVKIEKDGYATILQSVFVSYPYTLGDSPFAEHTAEAIILPKLGAKVLGKVDINNGSSILPLAGAELKLFVEAGEDYLFANSLYTTTSGLDGSFEFTNLPERVDYEILGATVSRDNLVYSMTSRTGSTGYIWSEPSPLSTNLTYGSTAGQFKATVSDLTLAAKNSSIVVDFSLPVDLTSLTNDNIYINLDGYSNNMCLLINKVWSNDNRKLTISPATGSWDADYTVKLFLSSVKSISNVSLSNNFTFSFAKDISLANVGSITLTEESNLHKLDDPDRDTLEISFDSVAGATTYYVYVVDNSDKSLVCSSFSSAYFFTMGGVVSYDLGSLLPSGTDYFTEGASYTVYVYAYNSSTGARSPVASSIIISTVA